MSLSGWHQKAAVVLLVGFMLGCTVPSSSASPPLTAAAAQQTIDSWNPTYCKVVEFYGFHKGPESLGPTQVAYLLLANPSDRAQKQIISVARFQLLTRPDGQQQWFLTSLVSHAAGLTRRQGWDNLIIPVKEEAPAATR